MVLTWNEGPVQIDLELGVRRRPPLVRSWLVWLLPRRCQGTPARYSSYGGPPYRQTRASLLALIYFGWTTTATRKLEHATVSSHRDPRGNLELHARARWSPA